MNIAPVILREIRSPAADAQILEWRWPSPMEASICEARHMLEMSLPPMSADGSACFPDISPERYSYMGRMFLRPAGLMLRARSRGGHIRVVRCAVDPDRYAATVERDMRWTDGELKALLHLRSRPLALIFRRLRDELMTPGFASAALVEAYCTALMIESARACSAGAEPRVEARLTGWQQRRIEERLEANGPPPSVAELARLCSVSPRHLLRLYRSQANEPVTAAIARAQVVRAQRLLVTTDLPLKTVAAHLGFKRAGSFSTAFRRATGVSPRLYRQFGGAANSPQ
jgi:AraC family transcriptional regulator